MNKSDMAIIGVGGAGCIAVNRLAGTLPLGIRLLGMSPDPNRLLLAPDIDTYLIGEHVPLVFHRLPPEWYRTAVQEDKPRIDRMLAGHTAVIIVAGLGGGTGSWFTPLLLENCKVAGLVTACVVTQPFSFEGRPRAQKALKALQAIEAVADMTVAVPLDRTKSMLTPKCTLDKVYQTAAKVLDSSVKNMALILHGLIQSSPPGPGVMAVDLLRSWSRKKTAG